jgi:membrane protease subunit (stomatin/prohibitin family)
LFYTNVCGNVTEDYTREELDAQLKTEFISALAPAFGRLSELGLRPNQIASHSSDVEAAMNSALSAKWSELRGIAVVSVAMNPITLTEEDSDLIKQAQRAAMLRDPSLAAGTLVSAQADAMKAAASNSGGAVTGFMGLGMAAQGGGGNIQNLYAMGQNAPSAPETSTQENWKCACGATVSGKFCSQCGAKKPEVKKQGTWTCACGETVEGKFCPECGAKKPEDGWVCACGAKNKGKFCSECGAKKPQNEPLYRCDKCGWEPKDPKNPPKFCPECGDRFDESDAR